MACAIVAAEFKVSQKDVLDCIMVQELCAFVVRRNVDLVVAVRETHKRVTAIDEVLEQLAKEDDEHRDKDELAQIMNWFDAHECAL